MKFGSQRKINSANPDDRNKNTTFSASLCRAKIILVANFTFFLFLSLLRITIIKYKCFFRADVIRQKSEAVRNITNQLIEEHDDYAR